ncbi:transporter substrate-binding domain-containing protein [Streptomyces sp. NPDC051976]|uniref:substrate-binding periplasmic protein n=1 Tax=Streptomyces sp. NPDC051976 TaxID=3154947 RepID=UPI0034300259
MFRSHSVTSRRSRSRVRPWMGVLAAGMLALAACGTAKSQETAASKSAPGLDTIKPGVLKVAIQPYAPYTSVKNGKIVGLDADILNTAAAKLGLTVEPVVTDFAGMLASVQSHRVDVAIGGIAWTAERQKQGLFTDPPYYSPPAMAVAPGKKFETVDDLRNQPLGTVEGYVWAKSIQAVPGAKLHAYPDATGVFDDLSAGRISAGFLDPLIIIDAQQHGQKINTQYLTPPTEAQVKAHPSYSYFEPYQTGFYLPKQEAKVEAALSRQIRALYQNGKMTWLIAKYGGDPQQFLKPDPSVATSRRGVDRPADWTPPAI